MAQPLNQIWQIEEVVNVSGASVLGGGSSVTFNGSTWDTGIALNSEAPGWFRFRAAVYSDQVGTINIQQARDAGGTPGTWRTSISQASTASQLTIVESLVSRRYVRVSFTNGATAQTIFEVDTSLIAI